MSSSINQAEPEASDNKEKQLACLGILLSAATDAYKEKTQSRYSSGAVGNFRPSSIQTFLSKLAQVCDSQRRGKTATALVCLDGQYGREYILASNLRNFNQLQQTREFLSELLQTTAKDTRDLVKKQTLQRGVLRRIVSFNAPRLVAYLQVLVAELRKCLTEFKDSPSEMESQFVKQLLFIQQRAEAIDMYSDENKLMADWLNLIKAILNFNVSGLNKNIDRQIVVGDRESSYSWSQVRHYFGRFLSFRQAADTIVEMSLRRPELFSDFSITLVDSAPEKAYPIAQQSSFEDIVDGGLDERDIPALMDHIDELSELGMPELAEACLDKKDPTTVVHCEVQLRDYLVQHNRIDPVQYVDEDLFIATSKPPCRLCRFYFEAVKDFQVRDSHMNVYPRWRLPDSCTDAKLLGVMIGRVRRELLSLLESKVPIWKRNDSRTDSHVGHHLMFGSAASDRTETPSVDDVETASDQQSRHAIMQKYYGARQGLPGWVEVSRPSSRYM